MNLFGDQAWRKIQRFLIQKEQESRRSKNIKKERSAQRLSGGCCNSSMNSIKSYLYTYRSVKAIQSKIYQIKPEFEREMEIVENMQEKLEFKKKIDSNKDEVTAGQ